jgi:hypothetical protein
MLSCAMPTTATYTCNRGERANASWICYAPNPRRWWKNSKMLINVAFPNSYFDQLGIPRLAA